jgi:hypothetical protein
MLKKIVFVPRRSRIRLYKIAKAVSITRQYKLILVCEEAYYDKELFEGLFDEVYFFNHNTIAQSKAYKHLSKKYVFSLGLPKLITIINKIKPDVVHAFCEPYDHIQKILKEVKCPVVMTDGADFSGISTGIENIDDKTRQQEKFCFENVKALIYKGPKFVTDYYRNHGYKIECEELTWVDHTDQDLFITDSEKLSQKDGEIHLVYTGHVSVKPEMKYCYYIPLAKKLAAQNIHLHLYPNPNQYKTSNEYLDLDKNEKYFHFHKPLPMKKLINEIAKYDWGLWVHAEDPSSRTTKDKMKTGMVNKMFSYLEAGLPVIVSDSRIYGAEFVKKHHLGFSINDRDWDKFDKMISKYDIATLKEQIFKKRKELSLQSNNDMIVELYNKLI